MQEIGLMKDIPTLWKRAWFKINVMVKARVRDYKPRPLLVWKSAILHDVEIAYMYDYWVMELYSN